MSESICDLETYYRYFKTFVYVSIHLCIKYNKTYPMNMLRDEKMKNFMTNIGDFETLFKNISEIKIKNIELESKNKKNAERNQGIKIVLFIYRQIFDFPGNDREISIFVSKNFVCSIINMLYADVVVHHSYVSGNIHGYAHDFCNQ